MSSSKSFAASTRKLKQASSKGDIVKSPLLSSACGLSACAIWFWVSVHPLRKLEEILVSSLALATSLLKANSDKPRVYLVEISSNLFELVLLPLFFAVLLGFIGEMAQTRALLRFASIFRLSSLLTLEAFCRKWSITDKNTEELFSLGVLKECLGNLAGFVLLSAIFYLVLIEDLLRWCFVELESSDELLFLVEELWRKLVPWALILFFLAGVVQLVTRGKLRQKRLSMTRQELEREQREQSGDPMIKNAQRVNMSSL